MSLRLLDLPMLLLLSALLSSCMLRPSPPFVVFAAADLPAPLNDEVLGLIAFKSVLQDPTRALAAWNEADANPCSWPHVECDGAAVAPRVVRLNLASLSLSGPLPRGLDRLPAIESLSLAGNNLSGPLPPGLSLLPSLRSLDLSRNAFSGRLPDDLALLPSIRSLDLSFNSFSGPIPESLFTSSNGAGPATCGSLRYLSLAGNRFEGPLPSTLPQCAFLLHLNLSDNKHSGEPDFARSIWPLSRLRELDLSRNSFSGPIPDGIDNLLNLRDLRLSGNQFSGALPASFGSCPHLDTLDLSFNSFEGRLPDSMRQLTSLTFVGLSNNQFSGDIPAWIGSLTAVQHLDLSNNKLTGSLPASIGELKDLNYLSLSNNKITGAIPDALEECVRLSELRLRGNELNGSIPRGLFNLGLGVVDLSSNQLTGTLPPGSTRISETLHSLDLSANKLTGALPPEMESYFSLRYLNFSWNELRTPLLPEFGMFRYLTALDLRKSKLYGTIPRDLCESRSLSVLQLDGNELSGPIPEEIGNCSSLHLLSLSRNNLNGSIPASMGELKKLEILKLEFNNLSGEIPQQLSCLENLLAVNISHNRLIGRLPMGGLFQSLDGSALQGNLGLCTPLVTEPCKMNVPKPLVLDPDLYSHGNGSNMVAIDGAAATPVAVVRRRKFLSVSSMVAISAALVIASGVLVITLLNMSARRRIVQLENAIESKCSSSAGSVGPAAIGKMVFFGPKSDLRSEDMAGSAEALLARSTEVGRGVFGTVYRASIGEGRLVAIKKIHGANTVQYHDDFAREVRILGKVKHPNLMPLRGYFWTPQLQLLISDYVPHGSVHARLHESGASPFSWSDRFKVVIGTAKGLVHLHQAFRPPIIHYNLKPTNILLDEGSEPVVADFGLARVLPRLEKQVASGRFQSSMGYMAPELACQSLRVNEKCDVYGFGVLILELVTGRKPAEYRDDDVVILIDQVRLLLEQGNPLDCIDQRMGAFPEEEVLPVLKLGLVCASQIPSSRPSMAEVVQILQVIKTPVLERMEAF